MKCFLIAQESWSETEDVFNEVCPSLLTVASLPFIEWQLANVVKKGVKDIRISGGHFTSMIERHLGNGDKWGIEITYIVCQEGKPWNDILRLNRSFFRNSKEGYLLIRGNVLFPDDENFKIDSSIFFNSDLEEFIFSPMNCSSAAFLKEKGFEDIHKAGITEDYVVKDNCMIFDNPGSFFDLNSILLQSDSEFGKISLPRTKDGIYIHESSLIHCEAQLSCPSVIGANTRIEKGAVISAFTSIGDNCIIDTDAIVRSSIIDSNTYIGKKSVIDSAIISNRRMYSRKTDSAMFIPRKFWVNSLRKDQTLIFEKVSILERISAFIIWLLYIPKLLSAGCSRKKYKTVISSLSLHDYKGKLKNEEIEYMMDKSLPAHLAVISALPEVIKGKMHLCGRIPLSPEQLDTIPPDFIDIFLPSRPGIITIPENLVCSNCFNRRLQDLYLCGKVGFLKRLSFFLESLNKLKHSIVCVEFVKEIGLKDTMSKTIYGEKNG